MVLNVLVLVNVLVNGVNILLDYKKLGVYKVSIEFMVIVSVLTKLCRIRERVRARSRARKNQELKLIA